MKLWLWRGDARRGAGRVQGSAGERMRGMGDWVRNNEREIENEKNEAQKWR